MYYIRKFLFGYESLENYSANSPVAFSQELKVSLLFLSLLFMLLSSLLHFWWLLHGSLPWLIPPRKLPLPYQMGGKLLGSGEWELGQWVWHTISHSLIQSQSTIGLCQKGKRSHVHLPCFFTEQANLNIAHCRNLSRIKIAQNKWQMAGSRALSQEMAKRREKRAFEVGCTGSNDNSR